MGQVFKGMITFQLWFNTTKYKVVDYLVTEVALIRPMSCLLDMEIGVVD